MRRDTAGFTLIEMMVVVVLIGVLASIVQITVGDNAGRHARQETDLLLRLMLGTRERAVLDVQEYGVRLEPDAYQLMRLEGDRWQPVETRVQLPEGLELKLALEGRDQPLTGFAGTPQLLWLSSDETTAFSLHFDSPEQRWSSIESDGLADPFIVVPEAFHES